MDSLYDYMRLGWSFTFKLSPPGDMRYLECYAHRQVDGHIQAFTERVDAAAAQAEEFHAPLHVTLCSKVRMHLQAGV